MHLFVYLSICVCIVCRVGRRRTEGTLCKCRASDCVYICMYVCVTEGARKARRGCLSPSMFVCLHSCMYAFMYVCIHVCDGRRSTEDTLCNVTRSAVCMHACMHMYVSNDVTEPHTEILQDPPDQLLSSRRKKHMEHVDQ